MPPPRCRTHGGWRAGDHVSKPDQMMVANRASRARALPLGLGFLQYRWAPRASQAPRFEFLRSRFLQQSNELIPYQSVLVHHAIECYERKKTVARNCSNEQYSGPLFHGRSRNANTFDEPAISTDALPWCSAKLAGFNDHVRNRIWH